MVDWDAVWCDPWKPLCIDLLYFKSQNHHSEQKCQAEPHAYQSCANFYCFSAESCELISQHLEIRLDSASRIASGPMSWNQEWLSWLQRLQRAVGVLQTGIQVPSRQKRCVSKISTTKSLFHALHLRKSGVTVHRHSKDASEIETYAYVNPENFIKLWRKWKVMMWYSFIRKEKYWQFCTSENEVPCVVPAWHIWQLQRNNGKRHKVVTFFLRHVCNFCLVMPKETFYTGKGIHDIFSLPVYYCKTEQIDCSAQTRNSQWLTFPKSAMGTFQAGIGGATSSLLPWTELSAFLLLMDSWQ